MKNRDIYWRRYKIQETCLSPLQSRHPPHAVLPASLATAARCSFCSRSRSYRTDFATTRFMPRSCVKVSDTVVLESPAQLLVLALSVAILCGLQPTHIQRSQVFCLLLAFQNVDHIEQILNHLWRVCATLLFVLHSLYHLWKPSEPPK